MRRYLTYLEGINFLPSIFIFRTLFIGLFGCLKMRSSVLPAFRCILFAFSLLLRFRRPSFKCFCNCLRDLFFINKFVMTYVNDVCMSFTYVKKSNGPRTCGPKS